MEISNNKIINIPRFELVINIYPEEVRESVRSAKTTVSLGQLPARRGVSRGRRNQFVSSAENIADQRLLQCLPFSFYKDVLRMLTLNKDLYICIFDKDQFIQPVL